MLEAVLELRCKYDIRKLCLVQTRKADSHARKTKLLQSWNRRCTSQIDVETLLQYASIDAERDKLDATCVVGRIPSIVEGVSRQGVDRKQVRVRLSPAIYATMNHTMLNSTPVLLSHRTLAICSP